MVVQHNLTAMNSNRMLGITTKTQAKSTEKLSSGYKINRAADDAAGLAMSEKMRRQIKGLSQASLNAADGISCVQTAEGALNEVHDMLQRINELAVKGENGTLTSTDRQYIQSEVKQLMSEIDRVQSTTTFNEQNLLDGSFTNRGLQVGAESGQHIAITIGSMSTASLINIALGLKDDGTTDSNGKAVKFNVDHLDDLDTKGSGATYTKGETTLTMDMLKKFYARPKENANNNADSLVTDEAPTAADFAALNAFAKSAVKTVSQQRSDLGAVQNRLEHTIKNLDNVVENTSAAESQIRDTDMATEMVKYSNNNILMQAGQSMLAQANQSNQGVLSLLG